MHGCHGDLAYREWAGWGRALPQLLLVVCSLERVELQVFLAAAAKRLVHQTGGLQLWSVVEEAPRAAEAPF